jgi:hypothetical protein
MKKAASSEYSAMRDEMAYSGTLHISSATYSWLGHVSGECVKFWTAARRT